MKDVLFSIPIKRYCAKNYKVLAGYDEDEAVDQHKTPQFLCKL